MNIIYLSYPDQLEKEQLTDTVAAIGFFDGIHKGHQKVIQTAIDLAKKEQKESAVISFHPHPSVVLKNSTDNIRYITTLEEKESLLAEMGVDRFYVITFNRELSQLSPEAFVEHFIIGLNISHLVAGFDYTFGHKGAGNMNNIGEMTKGRFKTTVIDKLTNDDEKISSTSIRQLLADGLVHRIPNLLGRVYETKGVVVKGDNRGGSKLGFPTANLNIVKDKFLPKQGVYAVKVCIDGNVYNGMANLGVVPTFTDGRRDPKVEVYIFDFNEDIYGKEIIVEWYQFVREEKKFSGIEEIVAQLKSDEKNIREFFAKQLQF